MAQYALVDKSNIKELTNNPPENVHPELAAMYISIPREIQDKISYTWRYINKTFVETISQLVPFEDILLAVKVKRDQLLKDSDKYMISDYPINDKDLKAIKEYRQKLRDLPDNVSKNVRSFSDVEFPKNPLI